MTSRFYLNRRKRLRKKKHMGEFALIGFRFTMTFPTELEDKVWGVLEHYADSHNLEYAGGIGDIIGNEDKSSLDLFMCEKYPKTLTSHICACFGEDLERIGCESEDMSFYNFVDAVYGDFDKYFE